MTNPIITIDGPTASGKGTVAQLVAQALQFHYLDSGALYRLTALSALTQKLALDDELAIATIASQLPCRFEGEQIWLGDVEVGNTIRAEEIGNAASKIAVLPAVREALLQLQKSFSKAPGLIADGRDMGTVVFPDASLKIYLTASVAARAERRFKQLISKGFSASMQDLMQDLTERDARDQNRSAAPLKPAQGAYILDTSALTVDQAVAEVLQQYASLSVKSSI
ncbi:(d)CMP kinase [Solimicrobium silvestre]|nr:(d)CMP kinase [Solimicrobium silvestre]